MVLSYEPEIHLFEFGVITKDLIVAVCPSSLASSLNSERLHILIDLSVLPDISLFSSGVTVKIRTAAMCPFKIIGSFSLFTKSQIHIFASAPPEINLYKFNYYKCIKYNI